MLHDSSPPPEFMTCGELVHQEEKFIREYASLYGIPEDVNRSEMLERIILLNPGSEACIPILKHFTARRGADGRIRLTGRVSPAPKSPGGAQAVPAGRRLTRSSAKKHVLIDLSQRKTPVLPQAPSPSDSSTSSGSSNRPPSPPPSPKTTPPKDISIIPEEVNPARRITTPFDTYSPGPSSPGPDLGSSRPSRRGSPSIRPMMEFVYPPRPRPSGDNADVSDREDSTDPTWLHKMLGDVQRGRINLKSELAKLTREANDAAADIMRIQILRDREVKEMDNFLATLRKIVGPEVVQGIIDTATAAAEERTSDEDEDSSGEDSDGESENNDRETDSQKTSSESSSSHGNSDDQRGNRYGRQDKGKGRAMEDEDAAESHDRGVQETGLLGFNSIFGSSNGRNGIVPLSRPEDRVGDEWRNTGEGSQQTRVVPDNLLAQQASSSKSGDKPDKAVGEKRGADSDPVSSPPSQKRRRLRESHRLSPVGTQPSPSRKRLRDSDGSDSAWEVEKSVKLTGNESSSGGPHKKPRSGIDAGTSLSSPSPPEIGHSSDRFSQESESEIEDKAGNDGPVHFDNEGDEPDDVTPGPSDNGNSLSPPRAPPEPPRFRSRLPPLGSMPWPDPSTTTSQPTAGPSSQPMSRQHSPESSVEVVQPSPGPSNPRPRTRGLTRTRERLRPTASGDVEAYNYDEGSDYELRLEREAETLAAWRRYDAPRSTYPFEPEFEAIRGAPNEPYVTFADEEEEETRDTRDGKGKGKEKA